MWFKKKNPYIDNNEIIYIDDQGNGLPLQCDEELYAKSIEIIKNHLRVWMQQDIAFVTNTNQSVEATLSYQLKDIDLKFLPYPSYLEILKLCLQDTEVNNSGTRLMDAFVRIYLEVPIDILQVLKGRYIYAMTYGLSRTINEIPLPSKTEWLKLLAEMPWCIFLPFIQTLYDTDDTIHDILFKIANPNISFQPISAPSNESQDEHQ